MKAMSISQCSTCFERSIAPRDPSGGGSREGGVMIRGAMMTMYDGRWVWHRGLEDACNGNTAHRAELSGMVVIDDCPDCDLDWMLGRAKRGLGPLECRVDVGSDILLMHSKHLVLSLRIAAVAPEA